MFGSDNLIIYIPEVITGYYTTFTSATLNLLMLFKNTLTQINKVTIAHSLKHEH